MTGALVAAAIIILLAMAALYRRGGWHRGRRRASAGGPGGPHEELGRGSHAVVGSGSPDSGVFCGDFALPDGPGFLGVVVDVVGDAEDPEGARDEVLAAFLDALNDSAEADRPLALRTRLERALEAADRTTREMAAEPGLEDTGASLAAATVGPDGLHWISIGNSRIYLFRDDVVHQVTVDQTFGARLARSAMEGQLSPADAAGKQGRDALTSYLGGPDALGLDASRRALPLREGDRVIVCTNAVHAALSVEQITAAVRSAEGGCSEALVEAALEVSGDTGAVGAAVDFTFRPMTAPTTTAEAPPASQGTVPSTARVEQVAGETEEVRAG